MPPQSKHPGIPNSVRFYRSKAKLSQVELAERLEVSRSRMSQLEQGQVVPAFAEVEKLAAILSVQAGQLFDGRLIELVAEAARGA